MSLQIVNPYDGHKEVGKNRVLASDNHDITAKIDPVPAPLVLDSSVYKDVLDEGASGVMFLDVTFPSRDRVPAYISHRLTVSQADEHGQEHTYTAIDDPVKVESQAPIVLSTPLRGERWLDGDSCCEVIGGHRWALTPINGRAAPVETFATDLVQLRKDGRAFAGPVDQLSSYEYYGVNVYCARAGTVVEVDFMFDGLGVSYFDHQFDNPLHPDRLRHPTTLHALLSSPWFTPEPLSGASITGMIRKGSGSQPVSWIAFSARAAKSAFCNCAVSTIKGVPASAKD